MTDLSPTVPNGTFTALVARALESKDDNTALCELVAIYEPAIRRAACALLGKGLRSSLDATDLIQSVHLQLIMSIRSGKMTPRTPGQLRSVALTLLRQNVIQHWRRQRCRIRHATALATQNRLAEGSAPAAREEIDPARMAAYHDLLERVNRHLRADERRIVIMRLEGYRTHEIAAELGIASGVLRVRLSRLRKRLLREVPAFDWS
ncbi:MAG: RNA polymerase sigma factor [Isosphaeraceae bacterium]